MSNTLTTVDIKKRCLKSAPDAQRTKISTKQVAIDLARGKKFASLPLVWLHTDWSAAGNRLKVREKRFGC